MLNTLWRKVRDRWFDAAWQQRRGHQRVSRKSLRLHLELLEDRLAPAVSITQYPATGVAGILPANIAVGPDGNLWYTDLAANVIGHIKTDGTVVTPIPLGNTQAAPTTIAQGPNNDLWFTELNASAIGHITAADTANPVLANEFPTATANSGPTGITLGPDGNMWFTEGSAGKIGQILTSASGSHPAGFVTEFSVRAGANPWAITMGPDGNLWFTETNPGTHQGIIGKITNAGQANQAITEVAIAGSTANFSGTDFTNSSITIGPDHNLWFTEPANNKIGQITTAGVVHEFTSGISTGSAPTGITSGQDGNVWFTELNANQIARITTAGLVTEFSTTMHGGPEGIIGGADGNLWFTEGSLQNGSHIGKLALTLPEITSANHATFTAGSSDTYTVTAKGSPTPTLSVTGASGAALPSGVAFDPATGILSMNGTPAPGTYNLLVTAVNDVGSSNIGNVASNFLLTVNQAGQAPAFTSVSSFTLGIPGAPTTFTVSASGVPAPTLGFSGNLPAHVNFDATTGILSGNPGPGTYHITFTANNVVDRATQDFTLHVIPTITEFSNGISSVSQPYDIAAGPDGNIWFTEQAQDQVGRITPTGSVTEFSAGDQFGNPLDIVAGPDGNVWFTEAFSNGHGIGRITPSGSVTEFATAGSPYAIAAGPNGTLWFTETVPDGTSFVGKIGRISTSGDISEFSTGITQPASMYGITAGPDGNIWFTENGDAGVSRIGRITPDGTVTEFSTGISANSYASDITAGPDGNLWFTEQGGNRIGRITTAGVVTEFGAGITASSSPYAITAGPDGNLWFTEQQGNQIGMITPAGAITEFKIGISSGSKPFGIATGPDGNVWFTELDGNRIARVSGFGSVHGQVPIANNDSYTTTVGTAMTGNVLANDTDAEHDTLSVVLDSGPSHAVLGSFQVNNLDGSFTYTPQDGFVGTDSFTYHAHDVDGDSTSATVTITVLSSLKSTYQLTSDGSFIQNLDVGYFFIDDNVDAFVGTATDAYYLQDTGKLMRFTNDTRTLIDVGVAAVGMDAAGTNVFILEGNGNVRQYQPASGSLSISPLEINVRSIGVTSAGALFYLDAANTLRKVAGGNDSAVDANVASFTLDAAGNYYELLTDGSLHKNGSQSAALATAVTSYHVTAAGTVYTLSGGVLYQGSSVVVNNVVSFGVAPDGSLAYLDQGGNLWQQGTTTPIDVGVKSLAMADNGAVYDLENSGSLWMYTVAGWSSVDSTVNAVMVLPGGSILDLESNGGLWHHDSGGWAQWDSGVTSIVAGATPFQIQATQAGSTHTVGAVSPSFHNSSNTVLYALLAGGSLWQYSSGYGWGDPNNPHVDKNTGVKSPSGLPSDTGVTAFSVSANDTLIDLERSGLLYSEDASGWTNLDSNVSSFNLQGNHLVAYSAGGAWQFTLTGHGAYGWATDGRLWDSNLGFLDYGVTSFAFTPTGLYLVQDNGQLWRLYNGVWSVVDYGVASFGADAAGANVFILEAYFGNVRLYQPATNSLSVTPLATNVQALAVGGSTAYFLDTAGNLGQFVGTGHTFIDANVTAFQLDAAGNVYRLLSGGNLFRGSTQIGSGIASFQVAADGSVVTLTAGGALQQVGAGGIATAVTAFQLAGDGTLYYLTGGNLVQNGTGTIDSGVSQISLAGDGSLYALMTNGDLVRRVGDMMVTLDNNVQSFGIYASGTVYDLHTNGSLYRIDSTGPTLIDGPGVAGGGAVVSLVVLQGGGVLELEQGGTLWLLTSRGGTSQGGVKGLSKGPTPFRAQLTLPDGTTSTLGAIQSTAVDSHGNYFFDVLVTGDAWKYFADVGWTYFDGGVQQIGIARDNTWVVLYGNGNLWTGPAAWSLRGSQVAFFDLDSTGEVLTVTHVDGSTVTFPVGLPAPFANGPSGTLAAGITTPTFSWSAVDGAAGYVVFLLNLKTGQPVFDPATGYAYAKASTDTSFTLPSALALTPGDYAWWVKGQAADGTDGAWSGPYGVGQTFTITGVAPPIPWTQVSQQTKYNLLNVTGGLLSLDLKLTANDLIDSYYLHLTMGSVIRNTAATLVYKDNSGAHAIGSLQLDSYGAYLLDNARITYSRAHILDMLAQVGTIYLEDAQGFDFAYIVKSSDPAIPNLPQLVALSNGAVLGYFDDNPQAHAATLGNGISNSPYRAFDVANTLDNSRSPAAVAFSPTVIGSIQVDRAGIINLLDRSGNPLISSDSAGILSHDGGTIISHDGGTFGSVHVSQDQNGKPILQLISSDSAGFAKVLAGTTAILTNNGGTFLPYSFAQTYDPSALIPVHAAIDTSGLGILGDEGSGLGQLISSDSAGVITDHGAGIISEHGMGIIRKGNGAFIGTIIIDASGKAAVSTFVSDNGSA